MGNVLYFCRTEQDKRELGAMGYKAVRRIRVEIPVKDERRTIVVAERDTMRHIREAIESGALMQPFRASDVNRVLNIDYAHVFLPKHRVGNPSGFTEHFVQIARGLYRLGGASRNWKQGGNLRTH